MWEQLKKDVRQNRGKVILDSSHEKNKREGRYERAIEDLGLVLAKGEVIGYRDFRAEGAFDLCELVFWLQDDFDPCGRYLVMRCYYSSSRSEIKTKIGYREFKQGQIRCFYDGIDPNPGKSLTSKEEAIECMKIKGGYHVV